MIIAYWIGPWLGVMFADQYLRRGQTRRAVSSTTAPMQTGTGCCRSSSAWWCRWRCSRNQEKFVGWVAKAYPQLGDVTFFVGFLLAGAAYLVLCRSKIAAERVAV